MQECGAEVNPVLNRLPQLSVQKMKYQMFLFISIVLILMGIEAAIVPFSPSVMMQEVCKPVVGLREVRYRHHIPIATKELMYMVDLVQFLATELSYMYLSLYAQSYIISSASVIQRHIAEMNAYAFKPAQIAQIKNVQKCPNFIQSVIDKVNRIKSELYCLANNMFVNRSLLIMNKNVPLTNDDLLDEMKCVQRFLDENAVVKLNAKHASKLRVENGVPRIQMDAKIDQMAQFAKSVRYRIRVAIFRHFCSMQNFTAIYDTVKCVKENRAKKKVKWKSFLYFY